MMTATPAVAASRADARRGPALTAAEVWNEVQRRDEQIIALWGARRRLACHLLDSVEVEQVVEWRRRYQAVGLIPAGSHVIPLALPGLVAGYDVLVAVRRRPADVEVRRLRTGGCVDLAHPDDLLSEVGWSAAMRVLSADGPGDAVDVAQARVAAAGGGLAGEVRDCRALLRNETVELLRRGRGCGPAASAGAGE